MEQTSPPTTVAQAVQPVPVTPTVQPTRMEQPRTMEHTSQPTPVAQAAQPTRVKQPMTVEQASQPTTVAQAVQPMEVSHAVQPTMMVQTGQPTTITTNPMGSQLIQMPNGQLFLLPSNSYPVAQPEALQTLQVVQLVGTNNPGFTASPM